MHQTASSFQCLLIAIKINNRFFIVLRISVLSQRSPSNQSSTNVLDFSQSLIANLQSNGLRGYVLFVESDGITSVRANIMGPTAKDMYDWAVHSSPQMPNENTCPPMSTSSMSLDLTTLMGPLETGRENIFSVKLKSINGDNTFIGRNLVLRNQNTGSISCGLILPFGSKKTYEAKFHSPVEGTAYVIQSNNITALISSLSYSTQMKKASTNKWTLMAGLDADATETSKYEHEMNSCNSFLGRPFFKDMVSKQRKWIFSGVACIFYFRSFAARKGIFSRIRYANRKFSISGYLRKPSLPISLILTSASYSE